MLDWGLNRKMAGMALMMEAGLSMLMSMGVVSFP